MDLGVVASDTHAMQCCTERDQRAVFLSSPSSASAIHQCVANATPVPHHSPDVQPTSARCRFYTKGTTSHKLQSTAGPLQWKLSSRAASRGNEAKWLLRLGLTSCSIITAPHYLGRLLDSQVNPKAENKNVPPCGFSNPALALFHAI